MPPQLHGVSDLSDLRVSDMRCPTIILRAVVAAGRAFLMAITTWFILVTLYANETTQVASASYLTSLRSFRHRLCCCCTYHLALQVH